jgi:hypothetical protein
VTLRARWVTLRARWVTLRARWVALRARWVTLRARWVTLRARWVTLRARWVTLRGRWVTLRARWVTLRARWVTLRARWVTLRARWVTLTALLGVVYSRHRPRRRTGRRPPCTTDNHPHPHHSRIATPPQSTPRRCLTALTAHTSQRTPPCPWPSRRNGPRARRRRRRRYPGCSGEPRGRGDGVWQHQTQYFCTL